MIETWAAMDVVMTILLIFVVIMLLYMHECLYAILVVIVISIFILGVWMSRRTASIYKQERTRAAEHG